MNAADLPIVVECNRCGECCKRSAICYLRPAFDRSPEYEGRCEFLWDEFDGRTSCLILQLMPPLLRSEFIDGTCNPQFHDIRREI